MVKHLVYLTALCSIAMTLLCGGCLGQASRGTPGGSVIPKRFFFGGSQSVQQCPSAWLIYLNRERDDGGLFVVANMEPFSRLELARDGGLRFEWLGFGKQRYRFTGTLKAGEITGQIEVVEPRADLPKDLCRIAATELPSQESSTTAESPARYSNMAYSSEGGDLTGVDIRFFSTRQGTQGMITFYESYWFEPVNRPLMLSQVEVDKTRIRFAVETSAGVGHYHLVPTSTGTLFGRDDVAPEDRGADVLLEKTLDVLPRITW